MKKIAQLQVSALLDTIIGSTKQTQDIWAANFAEMHKKIIDALKSGMQLANTGEKLKADLQGMFPGQTWIEFAYQPSSLTFKQIKDTMDRLMMIKSVHSSDTTEAALHSYIDKHNELFERAPSQENQPVENDKPQAQTPVKPTQSINPDKIKQLQKLLNVEQTGVWNKVSNRAFLTWLKAKGWDKNYIKNNKFVGTIDDAIRYLTLESAPTADFIERQSSRINRLKKI